VAEGVFGLE
jgi:hypothetical protein